MTLDFSGRNLQGHSFRSADLSGANFSSADIRGASFRSANLSGANFSSADIRGANFSNACLRAANFQNAKAGINPTRKISMFLASFLISLLSGLAASISVDAVVNAEFVVQSSILAISWLGVSTIVSLSTLAVAIATAEAGMLHGKLGILSIILAAFIGARFTPVASVTLVGSYLGWRSLKGNIKSALIYKLVIFLSSLRGTNFYGADLTDANFTQAILKNIDLRNANISRTVWINCKGLNLSLVGKTYLRYPSIQTLVTLGEGDSQVFDGFQLDGINLSNANLTNASLIGASLNQANFQNANLSMAVLKQTQLDGANLTGANLTGAFIQDWGITGTTKLDKVNCDFIYLRVPTQDDPDPLRKPDNRSEQFAPDDFSNFIQPLVNTLDLYHNSNVDPRAIAIAFKQLAENHSEAELEVISLEKRRDNTLLLRAKTASMDARSELHAEYFDYYERVSQMGSHQLIQLIAEKDSRIISLEGLITTALQKPNFYINNVQSIEGFSIQTGEGASSVNIGNIDNAENFNIVGDKNNMGNITGAASISIEGGIENIGNVENIEVLGELYRNIEVKLSKGRGMLVGKNSDLIFQVTNLSSKSINRTVSIEIQESAEYEILSVNPVVLKALEAQESVDISFCVCVSVQREIPVNYKINGNIGPSAIYITAIHDNPYVYGNPIGDESNFVGRKRELDQVIQAVSKPAKQDILIAGERRAGKTSLLNQLRNRIDDPFIPVYVVLNTSAEATTESILGLIFRKIMEELMNHNLLSQDMYQTINFPELEFADNVKILIKEAKSRSENMRIVLMLDEADSLLEVKNAQQDGIDERPQNILRAALQSREIGNDLRAVLAATTELATYMSKRSSPLFNHFRKVSLKPLSNEETKELIREPAKMLNYTYSDHAVQKIINLSGCQPYYCQALCYEAFNQVIQVNRKIVEIEDVLVAEEKVVQDLYMGYLTGSWQRLSLEEKTFLEKIVNQQSIIVENEGKIKRLLDWQIIDRDKTGAYSFSGGLIRRWTLIAIDED
jgi:uncharacterized protein YjbI with pentapeptide repeats